ncbi:MAG: phosphoenolpyruvate carboxylase [Boseongicola sp. SB0677_bin_26]|nr:phosphoenolpyruvate carboxylase [Boseongicola sp. SB0665_bin_10]MYG25471.1 phosphoenolpyruvate carboxylase [Boseongicola sp. SB0677_bin_26]
MVDGQASSGTPDPDRRNRLGPAVRSRQHLRCRAEVFDAFEHAAQDRCCALSNYPPCIRFHSWIRGDRDGNPNVTAVTTKHALCRCRSAIVERYCKMLATAAMASVDHRPNWMSVIRMEKQQLTIPPDEFLHLAPF